MRLPYERLAPGWQFGRGKRALQNSVDEEMDVITWRPRWAIVWRKGVEGLGPRRSGNIAVGLLLVVALLLAAGCMSAPAVIAAPTDSIPETPPPLPFNDNPDPTLCGIPTQDNRRGVVHGEVNGEPVGPIIYFYDSHLRQNVTGQIFPGAEVKILLSQSNPTLDYYFVKTINVEPPQEGWVPAPFVAVQS
jgi:hypothetical protein